MTRNTRIWYHPSLVATSTLEDVQRVGRHEDGMAKKRRVKSKHTGVLEEGIGTGRGKRAKVLPPTKSGDFATQSPAPSSSNGASASRPTRSRSERKPRPSRASAAASGPGAGRKRPRYAESDTDDFSDTTRDDDEEEDEDEDESQSSEDEDAEGETDEDASGSEEEQPADSEQDAEGEPDDEVYASRSASVVDHKGKGKARAVSSPVVSTAAKGKARAVASPAPKQGPAGRPRRSLPVPSTSASTMATTSPAPGPPTKRAAALAAQKAPPEVGFSSKETKPTRKSTSRAKNLVADAREGAEVTEEGIGPNIVASSSRRPRRSSALATVSMQRKQLTVDSSDEEATPAEADEPVEPVGPPSPPPPPATPLSRPARAARRRNSIIMEELMEAAPGVTAAGPSKAKPGPKARSKSTIVDDAQDLKQEQQDALVQSAGTRRTRVSRGGAAAQMEPEEAASAPVTTESAPVLAPSRRSARGSGARTAREADEATVPIAEVDAAPLATPAVDEGGHSHGTRRASRIRKLPIMATETDSNVSANVKKVKDALAPTGQPRRGRAPAATRGGRGAAAAARRGRGGAAASGPAGRGAASGSKSMRRGGAGFRAGLQPLDGASSIDPGEGRAFVDPENGGPDSSRTPHVYSLPGPPHVDKLGSTAVSTRDASVDASAEAGPSDSARSPSPASSQFLYPDASNPYGSSPYPAYPHQAQTPVMRHPHPSLPHKVYHSEPGLARMAFYYHGVSPLPRPYIHPEHDLSDDVLDHGDEASVFGGDFATDVSLGVARSAGAYALAAYRNGSPAARGPSVSAGRFGQPSPRRPFPLENRRTTESQISDLRGSLEADDERMPSPAAAADAAAQAGFAAPRADAN